MPEANRIDGSSGAKTPVFQEPSIELVRNALRDVAYEDRLVISRMSAGQGNMAVNVYGFAELVSEIFGTRWDQLEAEATRANLMWVDPARLSAWVKDVIGDEELADALSTALDGADHYRAQIEAMFPLFKERAAQYQAVLSADGEGE